MKININGKAEAVNASANLSELIASKGLCPEKVVVEHNCVIVARDKWPATLLCDDDTVEIVSFVGGG